MGDIDHSTKAKFTSLTQKLVELSKKHSNIQMAFSLGAEDMLLLHTIESNKLPIEMFFLDTGRMHEESYSFLHDTISSYQTKIKIYCPEASAIENLINENGPNGFYQSVDARKKCCKVRKVLPLQRALKNADCWITGQRREQSVTRASLLEEELDTAHGIMKFNPLALWTNTEIWHYLNQFKIKTHPLHQQNMPSIGCQPCTRAITQGEDERAGRWWWENPDVKECGLHQS